MKCLPVNKNPARLQYQEGMRDGEIKKWVAPTGHFNNHNQICYRQVAANAALFKSNYYQPLLLQLV